MKTRKIIKVSKNKKVNSRSKRALDLANLILQVNRRSTLPALWKF